MQQRLYGPQGGNTAFLALWRTVAGSALRGGHKMEAAGPASSDCTSKRRASPESATETAGLFVTALGPPRTLCPVEASKGVLRPDVHPNAWPLALAGAGSLCLLPCGLAPVICHSGYKYVHPKCISKSRGGKTHAGLVSQSGAAIHARCLLKHINAGQGNTFAS